MKTAAEIVEILAREHRVEDIVARLAKADPRTEDLKDLAQMVYISLLEMDARLLSDLFENGQENYYIVRVVRNQYTQHRAWYRQIRRFQDRTVPIVEPKTEDQ